MDEAATALLSGLLSELPDTTEDESWLVKNRRRLELIKHSIERDLNANEKDELQALQKELYRKLEDSDDQLLSTLDKMRSDLKSVAK